MIPPAPRPPRPLRPLLSAVLATLGLLSLLAGCTPAPAPTPTPTAAFASEEEAFAAAEETYRTYNDAFNALVLDDPATFEALYDLSSGDFEAADRKNLSELRANNLALAGSMKLAYFEGIESEFPFERVRALVCIDVSEVDVVDASGHSVTEDNRPGMNPLLVTFVQSEGELRIDRADRDEEAACTSE